MYAGRNRRLGFLYVLPALLFVLVFTAYPFVQMVWMSLHSWSLIKPPKFIGLNNFSRLFEDDQFWTSLAFTFKYTLLVTPILMIGGYLLALLTARNTPLRRFTRAMVFVPVVIGLGASSFLWLWLFNPDRGPINRALADLGVISGADPVAGGGCRPVHLGDHRLGHLEGHRLRHDPVRRRHPRHPPRGG